MTDQIVANLRQQHPNAFVQVNSATPTFTQTLPPVDAGQEGLVITWKMGLRIGAGMVYPVTSTTACYESVTRIIKRGTNIHHWVNEVRAMTLLNKHPHFPTFHGCWINGGNFYILMERIQGGHLRVGPGSMREARTKNIARQILQGTEIMHAAGIVHRDLNPQNILIQTINRVLDVRISDFDIAEVIGNGQTIGALGTLAYRAPEVLNGKTAYGKPVDLWSIGCLIYALFRGVSPFPETDFSPGASDPNIGEKEFRNRGVSAPALAFIRSLLRVNPLNRPAAKDVLKDPWFTS